MNKFEYLCRTCPIDSSGLITVFDGSNRDEPLCTALNEMQPNWIECINRKIHPDLFEKRTPIKILEKNGKLRIYTCHCRPWFWNILEFFEAE